MKVYNEELKDDRWKEKRESILKRDGHKCRICGKTTNLNVHHIYYERHLIDCTFVDPWDYPDSALVTLCNECHKEGHRYFKVGIRYRKEHPCLLSPGAWIDDEGKVVAPPFIKKEDMLRFLREHEVITYSDLKRFLNENKICYNKEE